MSNETKPMSRRIVFQGLAGLGVAVALAGCGGGDDSSDGGDSGGSGNAKAPASSGTELAKVAEIPVGGGIILTQEKMVITQPTEGTFKGYTASCTHEGITVDKVEDGTISCPAHGSQFSVEDGSVTNGPATEALPSIKIKKQGDAIVAA